jgi:serine/threonine-protein kinase ATR
MRCVNFFVWNINPVFSNEYSSFFNQAEANPPKCPPFFRKSLTFYGWLSNWCRCMIYRAHDSRKTGWTKMFYACRTALRTQAGLGVAEFLLPILVLDGLCFGNGQDNALLISEIRDVLLLSDNDDSRHSKMAPTDRRNAVSTIFSMLDLLQHWIEPEIESKYSKRTRPGKDYDVSRLSDSASDSDWQRNESAMRIDDLVSQVPLYLRGKAAFNVDMHASALRFLEMASRSTVVDVVFGNDETSTTLRKLSRSRAAGSCPEGAVTLMKDVLASLNDNETIEALLVDHDCVSPETRTRDSVRQKEALHDWQGALLDYERAQQHDDVDPAIRLGTMRCLLELGHFDSVLQQVQYIKCKANLDQENLRDFFDTVPVAVEASWRLCRWETLSELVEEETMDPVTADALYQFHLGKALLNVRRKNLEGVLGSIHHARCAVMDGLANVARESYSRAYNHVVRLQALREIEDVSETLCTLKPSSVGHLTQDISLCWNPRLDLVSSSGATTIINVRLVLARLASDAAYEGSLFLRMGKRGRKSGLLGAAANSFAQAETAFRCVDDNQKTRLKSSLQLQIAKLKHDAGESSIALRMLGLEDIESMGVLKHDELVSKCCQRVIDNLGIGKREMDQQEILNIFVRSALQSTRWMIESGLKEGTEIVARFRIILCVAPTFEKGKFSHSATVPNLVLLLNWSYVTKHRSLSICEIY